LGVGRSGSGLLVCGYNGRSRCPDPVARRPMRLRNGGRFHGLPCGLLHCASHTTAEGTLVGGGSIPAMTEGRGCWGRQSLGPLVGGSVEGSEGDYDYTPFPFVVGCEAMLSP
jgi:hypothetical protein